MKRKPRKRILQKPRHYFKRCRRGRDNKDYLNSDGWLWGGASSIRVPSLKASRKTWENFYNLFPGIKKRLMAEENDPCHTVEVHGDIITERTGMFRTGPDGRSIWVVRTKKFRKTWKTFENK